jgi:hypothetical protein
MRGLFLLLCGCANVIAAVYSVGPGQQFNSVSSAVEYATSGDEIIVYGGTYYGPIFFNNKNINLHCYAPDSPSSAGSVILRCAKRYDEVVVFGGDETAECQLRGFTLTGSNAWYGIWGRYTRATIANNILYNFTGPSESSTLYANAIESCSGLVVSNTIYNCRYGMLSCAGELVNNRIYNNSKSGLYGCDSAVLRNSVLYGNALGGINNSFCSIESCTIRNNGSAGIIGAIMGMRNSIVAFNGTPGARQMPDIGVMPEYSCTDDTAFDTPAYVALGTICTNPLFANASAGTYQLSVQSPCINAGQNQAWMTGDVDVDAHPRILHEIVDMGAYEYPDSLPVPATPGNIAATKGTFAGGIIVAWTALGDANYYAVYRGTNADPAQAAQLTQDCPTACHTDTVALAQSTRYYYWVAAHNRYGWSDKGGGDYGYVGLPPLPLVPATVSASDGTYTNRVTVTWSSALDATWYALYRLASPTNGALVELLQTPSNAYTDTAVAMNIRYYYWVRAGNTSGWSGFSTPDSGYILPMQSVAASNGWVFKPGKTSDKLKGKDILPLLGPYFSNGYQLVIKDAGTLQTICGPYTMTVNKNRTIWKYKLNKVATVNYSEKYNKKKALYKTQLLVTSWVHLPASFVVALVPSQQPTAATPAFEMLLVPTGRRTHTGWRIMQELYR